MAMLAFLFAVSKADKVEFFRWRRDALLFSTAALLRRLPLRFVVLVPSLQFLVSCVHRDSCFFCKAASSFLLLSNERWMLFSKADAATALIDGKKER